MDDAPSPPLTPYEQFKYDVCRRTVEQALWAKMSHEKRVDHLRIVLQLVARDGFPVYFSESENSPVVRIEEVWVDFQARILFAVRTVPPSQQRVLEFKDNPGLVHYWLSAQGDSPSPMRH